MLYEFLVEPLYGLRCFHFIVLHGVFVIKETQEIFSYFLLKLLHVKSMVI